MEKVDFIRKRAAVIAKAWTDPVYRQTLVANPQEVIAREFALDLPADLAVTILEDSADTIHLVLVDPADLPDEEKAGFKAAILAKAWTDPAFKEDLIADPAAALTAAFDAKIRPGVRVKVVEQTADHVYGIIPVRPATLSDADLDKVAGGMSQTEQQNIDMGGTILICGGLAIAQPEIAPEMVATIGITMYQDRDTVKADGKWIGHEGKKLGKSIGHGAKKVFHGW
ncbi:MAG: NHLP leader peptide family RiPP precursor [Sporomusaceae bacterium]|nr:NHLP leader peptide family RiPP precursor [Sporomusaceae bacterium]